MNGFIVYGAIGIACGVANCFLDIGETADHIAILFAKGLVFGVFWSFILVPKFWKTAEELEQEELERQRLEEEERKRQREQERNDREFEEDRQYKRQLEKERMKLEMEREVDLKFNLKERIENLKITEQNRARVAQIERELMEAQGKQLDDLYSEIKEFERLQ